MFPDSQNSPSCSLKPEVRSHIAVAVSPEFRVPVGHIALGGRGVFRTAMPEATVDEDRQPPTGEDDVWANWAAGKAKPEVLSESVASAMQC